MDKFRKAVLIAGDLVSLGLAGYLMLIIRFSPLSHTLVSQHITPFIALAFLTLFIFYVFNLYEPGPLKPNFKNLRLYVVAIFLNIVGGIILFYFLPFPVTPKTNLLITEILFGAIFILWRRFFYYIFATNFKNTIAFIGQNNESIELIKNINENPHLGYTYIGTFNSLDELSNIKNINTVVYVRELVENEIERLAISPFKYLQISDAYEQILERTPLGLMTNTIAISILERRQLFKPIRRFFEIIIALIIIIITLPVTIIAAIAIKLEDGRSIFYTQKRTGLHEKTFNIIKFQSMATNAEKNGATWADKNDSRVTRVGAILRKTHIDEIPQMLNVLRGDIAFVGPRPERPEFLEALKNEIPYYFLRQTIKPGFTGWAQIKFRYARSIMDSHEKFEYDLFYIKNQSLLTNLGIILKTIQIIFTH
ncbi:MAG: exopolysaccharide biosynthesis polyprenyl glycosylphosphotransferase [Candidatus Pacebacteria bacterium]|nr:exopolysaccharide biosynthesis polyprenyl glycosylphosphotransferase [Candidatus Paceibacterota bacterium]